MKSCIGKKCNYFVLSLYVVDHTRVELLDGDPDDPIQDYINASYVKVLTLLCCYDAGCIFILS